MCSSDLEGKYGKWLRTLPTAVKVDDTVFVHGGIHPQFAAKSLDEINQAVWSEIKAFGVYQKALVDAKVVAPLDTFREMIDEVNAALKSDGGRNPDRRKLLESFLGYRSWLSIHTDGPLWFRGYAEWTDAEGRPQIDQLVVARELHAVRIADDECERCGTRHHLLGARRVQLRENATAVAIANLDPGLALEA